MVLARPRLWPLLWAAWAVVVVIAATQNHLIRDAVGDRPAWFDSFRYPVVECAFWAALTPLLLSASFRFNLLGRRRLRNAGVLLAMNALIEVVHAFYRAPLHSFVYPVMPYIPFGTLLRYYLLGNLLNDAWIFWSLAGLAQLATAYSNYVNRDRELARVQLQVLRSQVQPHFLFNALNSVSALLREDIEAADEMISKLSDLLRIALKTDPAHEVTLCQEFSMAQTYLEIEQTRFHDRMHFSLDAAPDATCAKVPALILLPLVENAVRHGVAMCPDRGEIRVSAECTADHLLLSVVNSGPLVGEVREGIGLASTRTRLERLYPGRFDFSYRPLEKGGMEVAIRIPD
jgi:two-component system LytT family sensor kinase